jgi:hypothetical protein
MDAVDAENINLYLFSIIFYKLIIIIFFYMKKKFFIYMNFQLFEYNNSYFLNKFNFKYLLIKYF